MPALDEALRRTLDGARELLATLDAEHQALMDRDMERIAETASRKQLLTRQLNTLAEHRAKLVEAGKGPAGPLWDEFTGLLEQCRHQNRKNGAIIETARRHTQRAMDVLSGRAGSGTIYGAGGEARTLRRSRYATSA